MADLMYAAEEMGFNLMDGFEEKETDFWDNLCEESFPEFVSNGLAKELFVMPKKGRRKNRAEKRKENFRHLSEKEKKTHRCVKKWDCKFLDKFPKWDETKGTVHDIKDSIKAKDALSDEWDITKEQASNYAEACLDIQRSKEKFQADLKKLEENKENLEWDMHCYEIAASEAYSEYLSARETADMIHRRILHAEQDITHITEIIRGLDDYLEGGM